MQAINPRFVRIIGFASVLICTWTAIAFAFALQGHGVALYRGSPQPWWPSFGYSMAIFSVWIVLTPLIAIATIRTGRIAVGPRIFALALGLPITAAMHVALFALAFWPVYNDQGRIPTPRAMAEQMMFRNLDTNALFYLMVVGGTLWRVGRSKRLSESPLASAEAPAVDPLKVRSRGRLRLIDPAAIDWISAAGDYCEVHVGSEAHLVETSLKALESSLPAGDFARIHRGSIVRRDRIHEVRGTGRGDARIKLANGVELRLSRRYRPNLAAVFDRQEEAGPAKRRGGSRSSSGTGSAV